nr:hypothetical protein [uncultured bacterium]
MGEAKRWRVRGKPGADCHLKKAGASERPVLKHPKPRSGRWNFRGSNLKMSPKPKPGDRQVPKKCLERRGRSDCETS